MARKMRRRRRSRRRKTVSTSVATYQRVVSIKMETGSNTSDTHTASQTLTGIDNLGGETVNRKIVGVSGTLAYAVQPSQDDQVVAMFALWAHPKVEDWYGSADWDPFDSGPDGSTSYEGRPTPRPFARRYFAHVIQSGGTSTQILQQHTIRSRAQRLLRPGWILTAGLWVRSTEAAKDVRVGGIISAVVEN